MKYFNFLYLIIFIFENSLAIDYNHETFVLCNEQNKSFALKQVINQIAFNSNFYLNYSKFFDTKFIVDSQAVQKDLVKDSSHIEVTITTKDNQKLKCSFFDRKKNKVIIVGPGFTNAKEKMIPFAAILEDYDLLIINFRGHGYKKFNLSLFYKIFGFDSCIKLGSLEEEDVFAAINYVNSIKQYQNIIGLGVCFGAFVIAKTQAIAERKNIKAFDKIILDGCWPSLNEFAEKIKKDPYLMLNPQKGGSSDEVKWLFSKAIVQKALFKFVNYITHVDINSVNLRDYLKDIKQAPILFFYGKNDLTITRSEFEEIWQSTTTNKKLAVITSNPHVHNHLKSKEFYKLTCELFIEKGTIEEVSMILEDPEKLTKELLKKYKTLLTCDQFSFKPNKIDEKPSLLKTIQSFKYSAMLFSGLFIAYKKGNIQFDTLKKTAQIYGLIKLFEFSWRPAIKLISKI